MTAEYAVFLLPALLGLLVIAFGRYELGRIRRKKRLDANNPPAMSAALVGKRPAE
jgi:hypothetical protein